MKSALLKPPLAEINDIEMIELCKQLIRLPSYTGNEQAVATKLKETMLALDYDRVWIDEVGNLIGEIRGAIPGPRILFDGHIDTVEVSDRDKWSIDPFAGIIRDGYIFGRGASDMKCAVASMVYGLAPLAKIKSSLRGSIFVSGTVCEETFEGLGLSRVVTSVKPDYVVIGEASNLSVKRGQRGRAEVALTTFGKAAHSSNPGVGKNAVYMMIRLVEHILKTETPTDQFLGQGILELTDIISAPYPGASVVPHGCRVTFDRRLLVGETEESVLAPIKESIKQMQLLDPQFKAAVEIVEASQECYTGEIMSGRRFFPAWVLEESHPFVSDAVASLKKVGLNPSITKYSFCTNGSYSAGEADIPTIGFGPGREDGAHVVDENIEIEQLKCAAVGYQAIAYQVLI
ncbi:MAG: peptidase [Sporomusa sp.]|jgi:putative selenium metabolism hydrolase|nr:peptidase [Sporomusa sp.]